MRRPCALDAEHPLYILYSSGSTAKPKGILHSTGGYLTCVAYTHKVVFDLKPETDVYFCSADVGWVTGHSYIVYGPLMNGATSVMYEGAPDYPDKDIWWELCERYGVTLFYTAPTAIRACMKWGEEYPGRHDLSKLRLLGSVGEPINPKAWVWYYHVIGGERCPVVDTWWQTETGAIMISPLPGITHCKPGSATQPLPGVVAAVVGEDGEELPRDKQGLLTLQEPWPSMLRTLYGDDDRYVSTYFEKFGPRRTSSATPRARTPTTTSGSSAASTTCSTSPATACRRRRSSPRSSRIRRSPSARRSAPPTRTPASRSSAS